MSRKPSPLFLAALDANRSVEIMDDKIRNIRRPITKSEVWALEVLRNQFDLEGGVGSRIDRLIERSKA